MMIDSRCLYVLYFRSGQRRYICQISMDPGNMGPLCEWLPEATWPKLKSLERIKRFHNIGDAMQSDSDDWQVSE